jgi:hypothetical protein
MKFSNRDKNIIKFLKANADREFALDEIISFLARKEEEKPKNYRGSVVSSINKLKMKLFVFGVDLMLTSKIGRGYKATYTVSDRINHL